MVLYLCTVAQIALFWLIFVQNIWFWHKLAHYEKMCLKKAKKGSMPRVSIHNWSFEPNLTAIFKYLLSKTVRRNPVLSVFLRPKNEPTIEFRRTVLDSRYLNIVDKLDSNYQLWIKNRGIEPIFAISTLAHWSYCSDTYMPKLDVLQKYESKWSNFGYCAFGRKPKFELGTTWIYANFWIDQAFSRFSTCKTGWTKARESFIYQKFVQTADPGCSNILPSEFMGICNFSIF